jgi:DNA replication protein DnaC
MRALTAALFEGAHLPTDAAAFPAPAAPVDECQTCHGKRYISLAAIGVGHPDFGKLYPCPDCGKVDAERQAWRVRVSNLTESEQHHAVANFHPTTTMRAAAQTAARVLVERRAGWLTIWGAFGSGKSYLATAIAAEYLNLGIEARYWMLADLLDHLREAFDPLRASSTYSTLVDELSEVPLLVVDECAAFSPTPWALEKIRQLAERRYRHAENLATVWACNVDPATQAGGDLAHLFSRMTEFDCCELNDGDVRPQVERVYHLPGKL